MRIATLLCAVVLGCGPATPIEPFLTEPASPATSARPLAPAVTPAPPTPPPVAAPDPVPAPIPPLPDDFSFELDDGPVNASWAPRSEDVASLEPASTLGTFALVVRRVRRAGPMRVSGPAPEAPRVMARHEVPREGVEALYRYLAEHADALSAGCDSPGIHDGGRVLVRTHFGGTDHVFMAMNCSTPELDETIRLWRALSHF